MNSNLTSAAPTREKASPLWFFTGFIAVLLAGIVKVAIADRHSSE